MNIYHILCILILFPEFLANRYTVEELRCVVCKAVVFEIKDMVKRVKFNRVTDVGSHRMDEKGNIMAKSIPLVQSETFLLEAMENACGRMEDYARGFDKNTNKLRVVRLTMDSGLNPEMSEINAISDVDLNESIKFHCEDITDQFEKNFINIFKLSLDDSDKICTEETGLCQTEEKPKDEL